MHALDLIGVSLGHASLPPPQTTNTTAPSAQGLMGLFFARRSWRDSFVGFLPARESAANFSFFLFISKAVGYSENQ